MSGQETAESIIRGILDPKGGQKEDVELAHKFIVLVARSLAEHWKDDSDIEETCGLLAEGFALGQLALMATERHLLILGSEGELRAKIPLALLESEPL